MEKMVKNCKNIKFMLIYYLVKRTASHECFAMVKKMSVTFRYYKLIIFFKLPYTIYYST